jgi:hypothetical protein
MARFPSYKDLADFNLEVVLLFRLNCSLAKMDQGVI